MIDFLIDFLLDFFFNCFFDRFLSFYWKNDELKFDFLSRIELLTCQLDDDTIGSIVTLNCCIDREREDS